VSGRIFSERVPLTLPSFHTRCSSARFQPYCGPRRGNWWRVRARYHNYLCRYAWPDDNEGIKGTVLQYKEDTEGLPALWNKGTMMDRLVPSADGWELKERVLGGLVANKELMPDAK
jgi:hypothetical protein